ncbi:MAG TPA: hypothetical protein GXZ77_02015 [Papillibacter sp.]|nr:hypothetical protein [Papillibacter sp.]
MAGSPGDAAQRRLLHALAFTELEGQPIAEEQIADVELVYRVMEVEHAMPYYRFTVNIGPSFLEGSSLEPVEHYYVPAVRDYEKHGLTAVLTLRQW